MIGGVMFKIKVLGSGCTKCQKLAETCSAVADSLELDYQLVKVTDVEEIMEYGVMSTPALVIDEQVKLTGRLASPAEIKALMLAHIES